MPEISLLIGRPDYTPPGDALREHILDAGVDSCHVCISDLEQYPEYNEYSVVYIDEFTEENRGRIVSVLRGMFDIIDEDFYPDKYHFKANKAIRPS